MKQVKQDQILNNAQNLKWSLTQTLTEVVSVKWVKILIVGWCCDIEGWATAFNCESYVSNGLCPAVPPPSQLPVYAPGKEVESDLSTYAPGTHLGTSMQFLLLASAWSNSDHHNHFGGLIDETLFLSSLSLLVILPLSK